MRTRPSRVKTDATYYAPIGYEDREDKVGSCLERCPARATLPSKGTHPYPPLWSLSSERDYLVRTYVHTPMVNILVPTLPILP